MHGEFAGTFSQRLLMTSPKRLEFLYDFVSGPCYLASTQVGGIASAVGAELVLMPVLAGGILKATNNPGPLAVPAKAKWIAGDMLLWAGFYGVEFKPTPYFPIRTLPLLRGAYAINLSLYGAGPEDVLDRLRRAARLDVEGPVSRPGFGVSHSVLFEHRWERLS